MRSGIILAGGRSTRFHGEEKSLKIVRGKRMICRVIDSISGIVDEIIISVRDEEQRKRVYEFIPQQFPFVYDEIPDIGPLSGVYSGLRKASGDYVVILACDMPFINSDVIDLLFREAMGHDAAVPRRENRFLEPLHAIYAREPMLRAVEDAIKHGEQRIASPLNWLNDVVYVSEDKIKEVDPNLYTFLNVNRAEDMPLD